MKNLIIKSSLAAMAIGSVALAGPITTVPWNGHIGAATFSFDDGLLSQTNNLKFLDNMPDVSVTFFVCTNTMGFASNSGPHMDYAKKGHEIGNHTANHKNLTEGADLNTEIASAAQKLRSMGIEATSLATPYCAQNANVKNAINQEHFISRGCGGSGITSWNTEPDWMQIDSHYWQSGSNVGQFKSSLDNAANGNWHVQLNHGVASDWDIISAADIKTLIEYAVQKKLWVASFSTVGAYLRAHFTIDKANSTQTANGFKVLWTSPHKHMPKSVPLRVKIEGASGKTVTQKGKPIAANSDGTYTIEFMDLELEVTSSAQSVEPSAPEPTTPDSSSTITEASAYKNIALPGKIQAEDYDNGGEGVGYSDSDTQNEGSEYRNDGVDIVSAESGYAIGHTMSGEWLQYTVNVAAKGTYKVFANIASGSANSAFSVKVDGNLIKEVQVPQTANNDWSVYEELELGQVDLSAGKHIVRIDITGSYVNIDWLDFRSESLMSMAKNVRFNVNVENANCQIFDINGTLIKSVTNVSGNAHAIWNKINVNLDRGVYIMRYGIGKNSQTLRVRK